MVWSGRILPLVACAVPGIADAEPQTSPITDSNYSIELYDGVALGNTAVVGMGGATVALASGTSGTLFNPSAPAVRPTTDKDWWSWDYHFDYLNASLSTDYDNNGVASENGGTSVLTAGFGLRFHDWAGAITVTAQNAPVSDAFVMTPDDPMVPLQASALRLQFALARYIAPADLAVGISAQTALFNLTPECGGEGCESLFSVSGGGLELGATWLPRMQSFRMGAALASPIAGGDVTGCDPMNCAGWILPEKIVSPWRAAIGGAYRFAPTAWNQLVPGFFRDEKSVTVAADFVVTGSSENAFGLEAFGRHELQRSGRHPSYGFRAGVEYEWVPGRFRVRAGSYWEPGRFVGVSGRLHITLGLELRVLQFWFWGAQRRGRITLTSDGAERYANGGFSIGFWH